MGAGGVTSSIAMAACCAHHVTDVLPILGLTVAAAFLAQYRQAFMLAGLGINLTGIVAMLVILHRERKKSIAGILNFPHDGVDMKRYLWLLLLVVTLSLAGCAVGQPKSFSQPTQAVETEQPNGIASKLHMQLSEKVDEQGAVSVVAIPQHWEGGGDTIDFEIVMNTHSVDLSFDLAPLSTLTTDTGIEVAALRWQAPGGGHHVTGTLSFPAQVDGKPVLKGVSLITLKIDNMDVPERVFTWQIFR
jgi:hypothetical protein